MCRRICSFSFYTAHFEFEDFRVEWRRISRKWFSFTSTIRIVLQRVWEMFECVHNEREKVGKLFSMHSKIFIRSRLYFIVLIIQALCNDYFSRLQQRSDWAIWKILNFYFRKESKIDWRSFFLISRFWKVQYAEDFTWLRIFSFLLNYSKMSSKLKQLTLHFIEWWRQFSVGVVLFRFSRWIQIQKRFTICEWFSCPKKQIEFFWKQTNFNKKKVKKYFDASFHSKAEG